MKILFSPKKDVFVMTLNAMLLSKIEALKWGLYKLDVGLKAYAKR